MLKYLRTFLIPLMISFPFQVQGGHSNSSKDVGVERKIPVFLDEHVVAKKEVNRLYEVLLALKGAFIKEISEYETKRKEFFDLLSQINVDSLSEDQINAVRLDLVDKASNLFKVIYSFERRCERVDYFIVDISELSIQDLFFQDSFLSGVDTNKPEFINLNKRLRDLKQGVESVDNACEVIISNTEIFQTIDFSPPNTREGLKELISIFKANKNYFDSLIIAAQKFLKIIEE